MKFRNISDDLQIQLSETANINTKNIIKPGLDYIPATGKVLDKDDLLYGVDSVLDGWLTAGRFSNEFESKLTDYFNASSSLLVNSGSSANLIAFYTLTSPKLGNRQIKPGDEIITVAAGFPTTVNPLIQYGCIPVFLDEDLPTYNIDCTKLEEAITIKTKAIMIAHTLGNPFNLEVVTEIAKKYNQNDFHLIQATLLAKKIDSLFYLY